jgi:hypothetical protein
MAISLGNGLAAELELDIAAQALDLHRHAALLVGDTLGIRTGTRVG